MAARQWKLIHQLSDGCSCSCCCSASQPSEATWWWIHKEYTQLLFWLLTAALNQGQDESAVAPFGPWTDSPVCTDYHDRPPLWHYLIMGWCLGLLSFFVTVCQCWLGQRRWNLSRCWMSSCCHSLLYRCYFVLTDMIPEVKSMFYWRILECLTMHFQRSAAVNFHAISVFILFLRVIDLAP